MKIVFVALFGLMLFLSLGAVASAGQSAEKMYVEADYMHLGMNWTIGGIDFSANPPAMGIKIGTALNDYFAIEGLLGIGIGSDTFADVKIAGLDGKLNSLYGINALLIYPATDTVKVYGKFGYSRMDVEISGKLSLPGINISGSESYAGSGALYGVGVSVDLIKNHSLTVEYLVLPDVNITDEGIDLGKVATDSFTIGFKYVF
jgi:opacity protein-like surface antigen